MEKMRVKLCVVTLTEGGGAKDKALDEERLSGLVPGTVDAGF